MDGGYFTVDGDYVLFTITPTAGWVYEVRVIVVGDGTKYPSEPSNTVFSVAMKTPSYPPPDLVAIPMYIDGTVKTMLYSKTIPASFLSWFSVYRREFGSEEWDYHRHILMTRIDETSEEGKTYEYKAAWLYGQDLYSDFCLPVKVALPSHELEKLLAPSVINSYFTDNNGVYYITVNVARGDLRANNMNYRLSRTSGSAQEQSGWSAQIVNYNNYFFTVRITFPSEYPPITGETVSIIFKNQDLNNVYEESDWSDISETVIPSMLPRVPYVTVTLTQVSATTHVNVSWTSSEDAIGYKVEKAIGNSADWEVVVNNTTETSWIDNTTKDSLTYRYRVTALGDNVNYQDSYVSAEQSIIPLAIRKLLPPIISNLAESGIDIKVSFSDPGEVDDVADFYVLEMSENGGSWTDVGHPGVNYVIREKNAYIVDGAKILSGGTLRFRAYARTNRPEVIDSDYSEIVSITIKERVWLLRWNGTSWDDPSGLTGGWVSGGVAWSTSDTAKGSPYYSSSNGEITFYSQSNGTAWYRTRNAINISQFKSVGLLGTVEKSSMSCRAAFGMWIQGYGTAPTTLQPYVYSVAMKQGAATGNLDNPTVSAGANYACYVGLVSTADGTEGVTGVIRAKGIIAIKK